MSQNDSLLPFLIDAGAIRGRLVRLGASLDTILAGHDYPVPVAERLAETLVLAACLAGSLKFQGLFTLQIQAEGAISLVVANVTSDGDVRGYARFDAARLAAATQSGGAVPRYFGKGFLAFTIDQGPDTERTQGIVELTGASLADCALRYFEQSEQLATALSLSVRAPAAGHGWRAAALMVQRMPTGPLSPIATAEESAEWWNRAVVLLRSLREEEMFAASLSGSDLLFRLYHADGLRLLDPRPLQARCRCSAERVAGTLRSFPREDVATMTETPGNVVVTCEFCKTRYEFGPEDIDRLYA